MSPDSPLDYNNEGVSVKGEEAFEGVFFEKEEEIVEREIKRKLTKTPEEYAAQKQGNKNKALSRYKIKKALLDKLGRQYAGLYQCPGCLKRKDDLHLVRVNKNGDGPGIADYILLCETCREKRKEKKEEEKKANRKWRRKYTKGDGSSKAAFYKKIRAKVFERDGRQCVFCGAKENLGLCPLIPESKGGKREIDNYTVSCNKCRAGKGNKLPLEYIFKEINFNYWLNEQLPEDEATATPGATDRINLHLKGAIHQFLARITANKDIEREIRNKAERLAIKLSESDEDRKRERIGLRW